MATRRRRKRAVAKNPRRRRRSVRRNPVARANPRRRRARRNPSAVPALFAANPRRRKRSRNHSRSRRRSYRSNPGIFSGHGGFFKDALYVTGGFALTRVAYGYAAPMVAGFIPVDQPIFRIGAKAGLAFLLGMAGKRFLGASAGQLLLIGGMVEALNDGVKTFVAPYVPALADDMGVYPMLPGVGAYPGYGSSGFDNSQSVSGFDEAM